MLDRILEPEVMDSAAEAVDYDAMDHRAVNELFVTDFLRHWNQENPVLDVGTGTAQIPIELGKRSEACRVVAIDLAREMLKVAAANLHKALLTDRVQLECCDAKQLPYPNGTFAAVISNSIVHHILDPNAVLAEMVRVVKPGGLLFVRDLLRPANESTLIRLVDRYAADASAHQRQMFADSLHAALSLVEIRDLISQLGHDPGGVTQTSDRHWTWCCRL